MRLLPYVIFWGALAGVLVAFAPRKPGAWKASAQRALPSPSEPCSGGPPDYCANTTQTKIAETPLPPPAVNAPFRDPDFGSRMVRVTDAKSYTNDGGSGNYFTALSYMTDSSAEQNTWGKFDPKIGTRGGYRFVIYNDGGWVLPYMLDAATLHVTQITGKPGKLLGPSGMMNIGGVTFSFANPDIFYTIGKGNELEAFHFSTDTLTPLFPLDKCPGLPSYVRGYGGGVTTSVDDTKFAYYFGGTEQGNTTLAVLYDRSANNGAGGCYWYNSVTGMAGGTNVAPAHVARGTGQLPAPAAPTVTVRPGAGSLPAGDYYVEITALTQMNPHDGETTPSAEAGPIHLSAPGSLTVAFPSKLADPDEMVVAGSGWHCQAFRSLSGCTPFNVYIGTSRGEETLQNASGPVGGGRYTQSTPLNAHSAPAPKTGTAGYNIHNARITKGGEYVRIDPAQGQTSYFWRAGTNQVFACRLYQDNCGGHLANGYSHLANDPNGQDKAEVLVRALSDPSHYTERLKIFPTPRLWGDSHWSWNDANPPDTMPVCGSFYNSGGQGDGTQNVLTNPLLRIVAAYDREIVCVATAGPQKVWRFAHNRATGAANDHAGGGSNFWATPRGNVSQDGRFFMFTSDWEWSLGSHKGSSGCPSSGSCRTDVFIVELH